jgi:hypothetical protein
MKSSSQRDTTLQDLIVLDDSHQIDVWCERLGCTAAELANAIGDVGFSAASVKMRLHEMPTTVPPTPVAKGVTTTFGSTVSLKGVPKKPHTTGFVAAERSAPRGCARPVQVVVGVGVCVPGEVDVVDAPPGTTSRSSHR